MGEFSLSSKNKTRYTNDKGVVFEIEEAGSRLRAVAINFDIEVGWGDKNMKRFAKYLESFDVPEDDEDDEE